jgi:UDP-2,3-diacylglucosamine hydrolase
LLQKHRARHLIHGHTHRPATHGLDASHERLVLSDWDMAAPLPRADILRLRRPALSGRSAYTLERIPPAMAGPSGGT